MRPVWTTILSGKVAVAATIVAMAHTLGLEVVAEGVETRAQLEFVRSLGCELMQRYLFSPPVAAEQFDGLLTGGAQLQVGA
jgi:EAL domain-containing protein (putative c-di-GMP-specific phosphodiesterase class I)